MNIWIFNHHAQDTKIPGGTRHYDLAKQLITQGHKVTIFAAGFHYTLLEEIVDYGDSSFKQENIDNIDFIWIKTSSYKVNNWKRMKNIISYAWNLNFIIPTLNLDKPDIIIGTTVHPFAPLIAYKFSKKYKCPFIFEIRDLWPQSFIDMGIWKQGSIVSNVFKIIEKYTVNKANSIITLSPKTEQYLKNEYRYDKIVYIPNSVDLEAAKENLTIAHDSMTIKKLLTLRELEKFLCVFTGAIVKTNTIHVFLEVAKKIANTDIMIVLVGEGQEKEKYESLIQKESIKNIVFLDPVEKKLVPKLLEVADILLLVQGNIQWGSSNKLFDYLAAKKPVITSLYAKHNNIVEKVNCGYSTEYDNSDDMVKKIIQLYQLTKDERSKMGERGYDYVYKNHDIKMMANKLESLCIDLIKKDTTK